MNMNEIVTITVAKEDTLKIKDFYHNFKVDNDGEYIDFQAKLDNVVITIYSSKKENYKVVFAGTNALKEAKVWDVNATIVTPKKKIKEEWACFDNQIGSDEVGVGDFLAPMIVVAAVVKDSDIPFLMELGVHDSKKLNDEQILKLGPILTKYFKFSKLTLPNSKYNEMLLKGENLNSLKAKMHNRALLNLHKEYSEIVNIFVDQFVAPETYFKYLNDANEEQVKNITFKTKGESYYPCVALASVIARYSFLKELEKMEEKYKVKIPLGASKKVDKFAKEFINQYGLEEFDKIAKKNFSNYYVAIQQELIK